MYIDVLDCTRLRLYTDVLDCTKLGLYIDVLDCTRLGMYTDVLDCTRPVHTIVVSQNIELSFCSVIFVSYKPTNFFVYLRKKCYKTVG